MECALFVVLTENISDRRTTRENKCAVLLITSFYGKNCFGNGPRILHLFPTLLAALIQIWSKRLKNVLNIWWDFSFLRFWMFMSQFMEFSCAYLQVRDEYRKDYDPGRGGWGKMVPPKSNFLSFLSFGCIFLNLKYLEVFLSKVWKLKKYLIVVLHYFYLNAFELMSY